MSIKQKMKKQKVAEKDREDNRKFVIILAVATLALMVLMYVLLVA